MTNLYLNYIGFWPLVISIIVWCCQIQNKCLPKCVLILNIIGIVAYIISVIICDKVFYVCAFYPITKAFKQIEDLAKGK